jgi:hypothetical protein
VTSSGSGGQGSLLARFGDRLLDVEGRLERLLVSGWRNAAGEAGQLAAEADGLAELGVTTLAERLRAVAGAPTATEALGAISLALAACRLLRLRLAGEETLPAEDGWRAAGVVARRARLAGEAPDTLLPVARMAVAGGEAWLCLRFHGRYANERLLVEPTTLAGRRTDGGTATVVEPLWLGSILRGRLRWRSRHPLGAAGSIECCALLGGTLVTPDEAGGQGGAAEPSWPGQLLARMRQSLAGGWKEGAQLLEGAARLGRLHAGEADGYLWPDPALAGLFRQAGAALGSDDVWAVTRKDGALVQPLALLSPGGPDRVPELIHLVAGLPRSRLA